MTTGGMPKVRKDGRASVHINPSATQVLLGEDDVAEWDDAELSQGRRRDGLGKFRGKAPRVIPAECLRELTRRRLFETESIIRDSCVEAAKYLDSIVRGQEEPSRNRMRAAEVMLERFLGKPTERHQIHGNLIVEEPQWMKLLKSKVAAAQQIAALEQREALMEAAARTAEDIVDAEIIEDRVNLDDTPLPDTRPIYEPFEDSAAALTDDFIFEDDDDEWDEEEDDDFTFPE